MEEKNCVQSYITIIMYSLEAVYFEKKLKKRIRPQKFIKMQIISIGQRDMMLP